MAKFHVGQMVRVKFAETIEGNFYVGKKAVITEIDIDSAENDLYGLDICPLEKDMDEIWGWGDHQLEPITESYALVTWESMRDLWVPDHMREDA